MNTHADAGTTPISLAGFLRIAIRTIALLVLFTACVPLFYVWAAFTAHNPWPRRLLKGAAHILGVRIRVVGDRPAGRALLLCNHVSWLDIPVLAGSTGTAFVAHDGLAANPAMRWLASLNDTVFIARDRRHTIASQVEQVREALNETGSLTIFPEGTTDDGVELLPFKSALLSALAACPPDILVHPVWLEYGSAAKEIAWGDEPGLANFRRIAARSKPLQATVHVLAALDAEALAHRKKTASAAQRTIEAAMASERVAYNGFGGR